ncbi:MAG: LysR family transcriptional regulator [Cytophagales bacterium]|nr:LysR family transcriptional regulator [Rhizobacter sp.]
MNPYHAQMRRLPPLPELIAFEAVARHLSFTRAAAELSLTQSAVSHRVRRLEAHLGTRLLNRLNPGLTLTEPGIALLPELTDCLDGLARLGTRTSRRLRVGAGTALSSWWLVSRLPAFLAQHPELSVELQPLQADAALPPNLDVSIAWVGDGEDALTPKQRPLFTEYVFPVCSPRLLPGGRALRDAGALGQMTLLHKASVSPGEWSWPGWFNRLGITTVHPEARELHLAEMGLVLSAAIEGAGVALSRSLLVQDALEAGRLVVAVEDFEPMPSTKRHVARWPSRNIGDPGVAAFVDWLEAEAAKTVARSDALIRRPALRAAS